MNDGMPCGLECGDLCVLAGIGRAFEPDGAEQVIAAIHGGRSDGLAVHGGDALAQLARGLSDQGG